MRLTRSFGTRRLSRERPSPRPGRTPKGEEKTAWVADYVDGIGKRRLKTFQRKKEADAFAATATIEVREGTHVADGASATVEAAGRFWLSSARAAGLEPTTTVQYETHLRLHIVPLIGQTKISALTIPAVRQFEDKLRELGRSPAMVRKVMVSLGTLLADAQERGPTGRNVVRDIRGRRGNGERRQDRRQKGRLKVGADIPTPTEVKAIVGALTGRWRPILLTAIFTGLRASELRGLRWSDVDLKKAEIRVHQRADAYNDIGRPKSISGEGSIPAPPIVVSALREWKLACPNGQGRVEQLNNIVRRGYQPAQVAAGVAVDTGERDDEGKPILAAKYGGIHALRHFYASWCINRREDGGLGLPPKVVQERLGHGSIQMTMDVYGHLFPRGDDASELAAAEAALLA